MQQGQYFPYAFFQGSILKIEKAKVPIMTNALQYGIGVFDGIRGYYNEKNKFLSVFRLEDHYKRFLASLKIICVGIKYNQKELIKITLDLIKKNSPKNDTYFRPFAYAGSTNLSPNLVRDNIFDFALYLMPLGEYLPINKGLSIMVSSWRRISDNAIPSRGKISGSYINAALARKEAHSLGFDEAILLTEGGHVAEGPAENLFIVKNGILVTPPETDDIFEGITRRTVIEIARDLGIKIAVRSIDRSELYICEEAFFSGTGVQIAWIAKIDGRVVKDGKRGPITAKLQDLFFRIVKGEEEKYKNWCTKITLA